SRPSATPELATLSLHDALPISRGEQFAGVTVALVTPFRGGEIDFAALRRLVEWHVEQGTDGLAPVGTTGESPTVDHEEHERVIRSEEHTSELQSLAYLVCRLLL